MDKENQEVMKGEQLLCKQYNQTVKSKYLDEGLEEFSETTRCTYCSLPTPNLSNQSTGNDMLGTHRLLIGLSTQMCFGSSEAYER